MPYDDAPISAFQERLDRAIEDGSLSSDGWTINLRRYDIPMAIMGETHSSIEIWGPEQDDGTRFYASLDTNTYVGAKTSLSDKIFSFVPYKSGTEMRITSDLDREGNSVTKDENLVQDNVIFKGEGYDAVLRFAKIAEQATKFNAANPDYHRYSKDEVEGIEQVNSNSGPLGVLQAAGYDVSQYRQVNIGDGYEVPGADDNITPVFEIADRQFNGRAGFFEALPDGVAGALADPESAVYKNLATMMENLNPDRIAEIGPDNVAAPPAFSNDTFINSFKPK